MSKREKIPKRVVGLDGVYSLKRLAESWFVDLSLSLAVTKIIILLVNLIRQFVPNLKSS